MSFTSQLAVISTAMQLMLLYSKYICGISPPYKFNCRTCTKEHTHARDSPLYTLVVNESRESKSPRKIIFQIHYIQKKISPDTRRKLY